jgi:hypothetical protein
MASWSPPHHSEGMTAPIRGGILRFAGRLQYLAKIPDFTMLQGISAAAKNQARRRAEMRGIGFSYVLLCNAGVGSGPMDVY